MGESSRLSGNNGQIVFEYRCRSRAQAIVVLQGSKWKLLIKQARLRRSNFVHKDYCGQLYFDASVF